MIDVLWLGPTWWWFAENEIEVGSSPVYARACEVNGRNYNVIVYADDLRLLVTLPFFSLGDIESIIEDAFAQGAAEGKPGEPGEAPGGDDKDNPMWFCDWSSSHVARITLCELDNYDVEAHDANAWSLMFKNQIRGERI